MFESLLKRLSAPESPPDDAEDLGVAVGVLLIEAAHMDDEFDESERTLIKRLLAERFGLSQDAASELFARAEMVAQESAQLYPFTRLAVSRMDEQERIGLIEMLWEVAYADGVLDPEEDALLRRVASLIYVANEDRVAARQRVLARLKHK